MTVTTGIRSAERSSSPPAASRKWWRTSSSSEPRRRKRRRGCGPGPTRRSMKVSPEGAEHVRHVGESEGYGKLTVAKWRADETDAWEMTSLQAKLTGAEGVYRSPDSRGATFM